MTRIFNRSLSIAALSVLISMSSAAPSAASRVVALLIANSSSGGSDSASLQKMKEQLFRYGDQSVLLTGENLKKDELAALVGEFGARGKDADLLLVYYKGATLYDRNGASYIVPDGWSGNENDLFSLTELSRVVRGSGKGGRMMFIDAQKGASASGGWNAGLGGAIDRDLTQGGIQLAYLAPPAGGDGVTGPGMIDALQSLTGKKNEPLKVGKLAWSVQEEVSMGTRGRAVPRVMGKSDLMASLQEVSKDGQVEKSKKCVAERARDGGKGGVRVVLGVQERQTALSTSTEDLATTGPKRAKSAWFCPLFEESKESPGPSESKPAPDRQKPKTRPPASVEKDDPPAKPPRRVADKGDDSGGGGSSKRGGGSSSSSGGGGGGGGSSSGGGGGGRPPPGLTPGQ